MDCTCAGIDFRRARALPADVSRFTDLKGRATVTGVGCFDIPHGQTGIAPNGIELHPVLKFSPSSCSH